MLYVPKVYEDLRKKNKTNNKKKSTKKPPAVTTNKPQNHNQKIQFFLTSVHYLNMVALKMWKQTVVKLILCTFRLERETNIN